MSNPVHEAEVKFEWGCGQVTGNKIIGKLSSKTKTSALGNSSAFQHNQRHSRLYIFN